MPYSPASPNIQYALIDAGINVTLNTDDPGSFATDLTTELELVHEHHDVSLTDLRTMQRAALSASFADAAVRAVIDGEIGAYSLP